MIMILILIMMVVVIIIGINQSIASLTSDREGHVTLPGHGSCRLHYHVLIF